MFKVLTYFFCIILLSVLLLCQNSITSTNDNIALLQKTDFVVRSTDNQLFCKNIYDSNRKFYRNSDTIRIVVKGRVDCLPITANFKISNDTLLLNYYNPILVVCTDTLRYTYIEYGFKIQKEGKLRVIARDTLGSPVDFDTLVNTNEIVNKYTCE